MNPKKKKDKKKIDEDKKRISEYENQKKLLSIFFFFFYYLQHQMQCSKSCMEGIIGIDFSTLESGTYVYSMSLNIYKPGEFAVLD